MYEIESMMRAFAKLDKDKPAAPMSDEAFDRLKDSAREIMPDVRF